MKEKNKNILAGVLIVVIGLISLAFGWISSKYMMDEIIPPWFVWVGGIIVLFIVWELIYILLCIYQDKTDTWGELKWISLIFGFVGFILLGLVGLLIRGIIQEISKLVSKYGGEEIFLLFIAGVLLVSILVGLGIAWKNMNKSIFKNFKKVKR